MFLLLFGSFNLLEKVPSIGQNTLCFALAGGLSGFLAGLIWNRRSVTGSCFECFWSTQDKLHSHAAAVALVVDATRISIYFSQGFLSTNYYWYIPLLLAAALIGSLLGKQIVDRVPQRRFKIIVSVAIALARIKFVVDWLL